MSRYAWKATDDVVAFYLSRHGAGKLRMTLEAISQSLGMSVDSLKSRMSNFNHLDGRSGLPHAAKLSRAVHVTLRHLKEPVHRVLALDVLKKST